MRIPTAHIIPALQAKERFGAIGELLDRMVHAGSVPRLDRDSIFHALSQREHTMSTGVGWGFALPHAQFASLAEPVVAFGRSPGGLEFNSLDGLPVEFVLLFVFRSFDEHLQMIRGLAVRLQRGRRAAIRACSTAEEISAILNGDSEP